jgi:hypothetical protein
MQYWKVKAASLERALRLEQLQADAAKVDAAFKAVMESEGLDATKNYRLTDADETIVEVEKPDGA